MNSIRALFVSISLLSVFAVAADAPPAYVKHCVSCHAQDGSGRNTRALGKVPDLRSKRFVSLSDEQLYNAIAHGTGHQAYAHSFLQVGVSEQELKDIVRYIRALQRSRPQPANER